MKGRVRESKNVLISKAKCLSKGWNDLLQIAIKRSYPSNNTKIESISATSLSDKPTFPSSTCSGADTVLPIAAVNLTPKLITKVWRPGWELPVHFSLLKKKVSTRCCKFGCIYTNLSNENTKFHLVPTYTETPKRKSPKKGIHINQTGKILLCWEIIDRMMSDRSNKTSEVMYVTSIFLKKWQNQRGSNSITMKSLMSLTTLLSHEVLGQSQQCPNQKLSHWVLGMIDMWKGSCQKCLGEINPYTRHGYCAHNNCLNTIVRSNIYQSIHLCQQHPKFK